MALALKSQCLARPAVRPATRAVRPCVVVRASPVDINKKVEEAVKSAEETCAKGTTADCAVAWDTVEELSAAASHKKVAASSPEAKDPLEQFCADAPDADECRVYE